MNLLFEFWKTFTAEVQLPGTVSQSAATDLLQLDAPTLSDQEGDDWFVAIATMYESFDIITQATYVQLRNHVDNNETGANDLFGALNQGIQELPETVVVVAALQLQFDTLALAEVPTSITLLETARDAQSDPDLTVAYNEAIAALQRRDQELTTILS